MLVLSDDETMLADAARGLIERTAPVAAFRALRDARGPRHDAGLYAQLSANGLVGPNVAEVHGGVGLGAVAAGVIAEQAGHMLAAAPLLSAAMAAEVLARAASPVQQSRLLPAIVAGERIVALALDEASRHDPDRLDASATGAGDGWRVTGCKTAVVDGTAAGSFVVSARVDGRPALFLVDAAADGVAVAPLAGIDSRDLARVTFADAAAEPLDGGDAVAAIAAALDLGRVLLSAELLGIADEAFARTLGYLREREQFGRRIGTFQALQHRAARLYARLDIARGVVLKALRAFDAGAADAGLLASLAKAVMTQLARDVLAEAVQMHGGIGVTDEFDIGLFLKRARMAGDQLGDRDFHVDRLARERWAL